MKKKMIFSDFFPAAKKIMEKKYIFLMCITVFGLLPNLYCGEENFCIATLVLYCKREGWKKIVVKIVLQNNFCIVEKKA